MIALLFLHCRLLWTEHADHRKRRGRRLIRHPHCDPVWFLRPPPHMLSSGSLSFSLVFLLDTYSSFHICYFTFNTTLARAQVVHQTGPGGGRRQRPCSGSLSIQLGIHSRDGGLCRDISVRGF